MSNFRLSRSCFFGTEWAPSSALRASSAVTRRISKLRIELDRPIWPPRRRACQDVSREAGECHEVVLSVESSVHYVAGLVASVFKSGPTEYARWTNFPWVNRVIVVATDRRASHGHLKQLLEPPTRSVGRSPASAFLQLATARYLSDSVGTIVCVDARRLGA
jgi:hypothetical protein